MKCPRNKFQYLDYNTEADIELQKQEICRACVEYKGENYSWGQHCGAALICLVTGEQLGSEALYKLPKSSREHTTHTLSDKGQEEWNRRLEQIKKHTNRPLW